MLGSTPGMFGIMLGKGKLCADVRLSWRAGGCTLNIHQQVAFRAALPCEIPGWKE